MRKSLRLHEAMSQQPPRVRARRGRVGRAAPEAGVVSHLPPAPLVEAVPARILRLQATVGNHSAGRLLGVVQRDDGEGAAAEAAGKPLTPPQVANALSYYRSQPRRYMPAIITQIQEALGRPGTGVIAEEDVQAVAAWQATLTAAENPSLKVDGKAGPRTLPTLFRQGLAAAAQIESYTGEAREILDEWEALGTAEARINKLVAKVNEYLAAAGVPPCGTIISDAAGNLGQFDFTTWSLDIGKPAFETAHPTPAEKADMADTIYHESRHAEQWYRMAQFQASQGKSGAQIAKDTMIKKEIAEKAATEPLKKGSMEALIAEGWNESVYGSRGAYRNRVLKELSASGTAQAKAQAAYDKDPTPANALKLEAAKARHAKALEDYYDLPEENDANRIGGRVTTAYMAGETP